MNWNCFIVLIAINAQSTVQDLTEDTENFETQLCAVYAPNNQDKCIEVVGKLRELYNLENERSEDNEDNGKIV